MADIKSDNPTNFSRPKFVIGIDFGTTFSGYVLFLTTPKVYRLIFIVLRGRWKDAKTTSRYFRIGPEEETVCLSHVRRIFSENTNNPIGSSQKVPTTISYSGKEARWGYQVDDLTEAIQGVKLLLDQNQKIDFKPSAASEDIMRRLGKKPVEVAGEYLKKVKEHTESILRRRGLQTLLTTMDIQYILTVPAVWSDKAKDNTKQAAILAGFPRSKLFLLSEPEAAAVYAISAIQPNCLSVRAKSQSNAFSFYSILTINR